MTTWSTRGRLRTSNKYPKLLLWHENGSEYLILSLGCERSYAIETREDEKPPYMHTAWRPGGILQRRMPLIHDRHLDNVV